jgi:hypothetical protein
VALVLEEVVFPAVEEVAVEAAVGKPFSSLNKKKKRSEILNAFLYVKLIAIKFFQYQHQ